jgi:hypothetical protein
VLAGAPGRRVQARDAILASPALAGGSGSGIFLEDRLATLAAPDASSLRSVMQLTSVLRCPVCDHESEEQMPTDACVFFHRCPGCDQLLRPRDGDCCVFCSYGSVPCPPVQQQDRCC